MKKKALRVLAGALGLGIVFYAAMGASALKVYAETEYEYDDLNRLTKERHDDGTVIYYSYDSNGNLLDVRIEDSNDTENENPDETPDKTPDNGSFGNTDKNAGDKGGTDSENSGNNDAENRPGTTGNDETGKAESDGENVGGHGGDNKTKDLSLEGQEENGKSGAEDSFGQEKTEEGISGNDGGNGTAASKALAALIVVAAALSGGIFAWKKKQGNKEGEGKKRE